MLGPSRPAAIIAHMDISERKIISGASQMAAADERSATLRILSSILRRSIVYSANMTVGAAMNRERTYPVAVQNNPAHDNGCEGGTGQAMKAKHAVASNAAKGGAK